MNDKFSAAYLGSLVRQLVERGNISEPRAMEAVAFAVAQGRHLIEHRQFDPDHYMSESKIKAAPTVLLVHYLVAGWKRGFTPSPGFNSKRYEEKFPYCRHIDISPLEVFTKFGRFQGQELPRTGDIEAVAAAIPSIEWPAPNSTFALVVHAHYLEELEHILAVLIDSGIFCDLLITTTHSVNEARKFLAGLEPLVMIQVPNHGRDAFPFMHLLNSGLLDRYPIIGKVHTKRSAHRNDGGTWFKRGVADILNEGCVSALQGNSSIGMVVPQGMLGRREYLEASWWRLLALAYKSGWQLKREEIRFPMGTMFWARREVLRPLLALGLSPFDFEIESGQLDGTLAHALERLLGVACLKSGYQIIECPRPTK